MVVLNIFHVLIAIAMVALVLVQRGAGATAGAAFGSGASGTVFGARGAGTFLTKSTWVLATLFCAISLTMAVLVSRLDRAPDANLGVVGAAPAAVEPAPAPVSTDVTEELTGEEPGDLPVLPIDEDESGGAELLQEQTTGDLPSLDSEATEATEVDEESGAAGSESEDS